jgi:hypothetical protein
MSTFTDIAATTLQAAMANSRAGVQSQVNDWNEALKTDYLTVFNNWALSVLAGRADNSNPPKPPNAYVVGFFTDSTNSLAQWAYPVAGTQPVSAMPAVPPAIKPYTAPVLPEPDNVRCVTAGDTMPVGYRVTAADGGVWQKQASPTPFGIEYYYARIA